MCPYGCINRNQSVALEPHQRVLYIDDPSSDASDGSDYLVQKQDCVLPGELATLAEWVDYPRASMRLDCYFACKYGPGPLAEALRTATRALGLQPTDRYPAGAPVVERQQSYKVRPLKTTVEQISTSALWVDTSISKDASYNAERTKSFVEANVFLAWGLGNVTGVCKPVCAPPYLAQLQLSISAG